jgi:hypothetical protein
MKIQAHFSTDHTTGTRNWHASMIGFVALFGAWALLLTLQSGALLSSPLLERMRTSPAIGSEIGGPHRVSLNLHSWKHPSDQWKQFSVANPPPVNVAQAQQFSIGVDERGVFKAYGDAAIRDMSGEKEAVPQPQARNDRMVLMLMLLGLGTHHR